jgi:hypothetical protein
MNRMKRVVLGVFVLLALACAPARASQTPATKRLEEDRKQLHGESRKEAVVHNKLIGSLSHDTERIAHQEVKVEVDQSETAKIEKEIETEEAGGAPRQAHLENLEALAKKHAAKTAQAAKTLAVDEIEAAEAQRRGESELAVLEAQKEATEAQVAADEAAIAEGG